MFDKIKKQLSKKRDHVKKIMKKMPKAKNKQSVLLELVKEIFVSVEFIVLILGFAILYTFYSFFWFFIILLIIVWLIYAAFNIFD